jgi:hypothetical protein
VTDSLPSAAYPPFTDANWSGAPSPAFPPSASAPLLPGIYRAVRTTGETSTDRISMKVQRFESCTDIPDACVLLEGEEIAPEDLGVVANPSRQLTLPLDAAVDVGVSGIDCQADTRLAGGTELAALMQQFDDDYAAAIATVPPADLRAADVDRITAALVDSPSGRFEIPECFQNLFPPGTMRWRGDAGPGVLMQSPLAVDPATGELGVPASASSAWLRLTAIEIAGSGTPTLYFDAGFVA